MREMADELIEGRVDLAPRNAKVAGFIGQERRRPGRQADVSPELIALMRRPTSASARVRVALYAAPGFLLPQVAAPRRRQDAAFLLRAAGLTVALSLACGGLVETMCLLWG